MDARPGLPDAFISVNIVEALGKQLTNPGEMVRGYAAIAVGYLTFNPIAKRQLLNMFVPFRSAVAPVTALCYYCSGIMRRRTKQRFANVISWKCFFFEFSYGLGIYSFTLYETLYVVAFTCKFYAHALCSMFIPFRFKSFMDFSKNAK